MNLPRSKKMKNRGQM